MRSERLQPEQEPEFWSPMRGEKAWRERQDDIEAKFWSPMRGEKKVDGAQECLGHRVLVPHEG